MAIIHLAQHYTYEAKTAAEGLRAEVQAARTSRTPASRDQRTAKARTHEVNKRKSGVAALIASERDIYETRFHDLHDTKSEGYVMCILVRTIHSGKEAEVLLANGETQVIPRGWMRGISQSDADKEAAGEILSDRVKQSDTGGAAALIDSGKDVFEAFYYDRRRQKSEERLMCVIFREMVEGTAKVVFEDGDVQEIPKDWMTQLETAEAEQEAAICKLRRETTEACERYEDHLRASICVQAGALVLIESGRKVYSTFFYDRYRDGRKSESLSLCVKVREVENGDDVKVLLPNGDIQVVPRDWIRQMSRADFEREAATKILRSQVCHRKSGGQTALIASGKTIYETYYYRSTRANSKSEHCLICVMLREMNNGQDAEVLLANGEIQVVPTDWMRQMSQVDVDKLQSETEEETAIRPLIRQVCNEHRSLGASALIDSGNDVFEAFYHDRRRQKSEERLMCVKVRETGDGRMK
eukprot:COSAG02_NODE_12983_length_1464_cov_3.526740_1_plen_469_part_01